MAEFLVLTAKLYMYLPIEIIWDYTYLPYLAIGGAVEGANNYDPGYLYVRRSPIYVQITNRSSQAARAQQNYGVMWIENQGCSRRLAGQA